MKQQIRAKEQEIHLTNPETNPTRKETGMSKQGTTIKETDLTKKEIMAAIVKCARRLGRPPTVSELAKMTGVRNRALKRYFGKYTWALRECNLRRTGAGQKVELEELFRDWATVARKLKKIPSVVEYSHLSDHSETPLRARYKSWRLVPRRFKEYAEEHGWTKKWHDVLEMVATHEAEWGQRQGPAEVAAGPRLLPDRPVYGPVMHARQLAHGPVNEAGVIYLFGTMAERLGFVVMRIQQAFPDCEAMRRVDHDRWQWVRIEFEYESRNFLKHRHRVSKCDVIVCWKHNWPECPLEVVELSKLIGRSGDRA